MTFGLRFFGFATLPTPAFVNNKNGQRPPMFAGVIAATLFSMPLETFALGEADGQWFKVVYRTKNALQINTKSGTISKGRAKDHCYTRLDYTPNRKRDLPGTYLGEIICETAPGVFKDTGRTVDFTELPGGKTGYAEHDHGRYANPEGHTLNVLGNGFLTITTDKADQFQRAVFQTRAAALENSTLDGATTLIGGLTVKGESIEESKLPFSP